jgi:tryptophan 7-halogenase
VRKTWQVKFRSGRYERAWVKNVVAIGNSAGFVEPLESTALGVLAYRACRATADIGPRQEMVEIFHKLGPTVAFRAHGVPRVTQFGGKGYLSLLLGMEVPYERRLQLSAEELANWKTVQQHMRQRAMQAPSTRQAMAMVRSPQWVWPEQAWAATDPFGLSMQT